MKSQQWYRKWFSSNMCNENKQMELDNNIPVIIMYIFQTWIKVVNNNKYVNQRHISYITEFDVSHFRSAKGKSVQFPIFFHSSPCEAVPYELQRARLHGGDGSGRLPRRHSSQALQPHQDGQAVVSISKLQLCHYAASFFESLPSSTKLQAQAALQVEKVSCSRSTVCLHWEPFFLILKSICEVRAGTYTKYQADFSGGKFSGQLLRQFLKNNCLLLIEMACSHFGVLHTTIHFSFSKHTLAAVTVGETQSQDTQLKAEDVLNKQKVLLYSHRVFLHAKSCDKE